MGAGGRKLEDDSPGRRERREVKGGLLAIDAGPPKKLGEQGGNSETRGVDGKETEEENT